MGKSFEQKQREKARKRQREKQKAHELEERIKKSLDKLKGK